MGEILKKIQNKKYSPVLESIKAVPEQFLSAYEAKLDLPTDYKKIKNIVLCGMGGSALAAHILEAMNVSSTPFCFYNGYEVPKFVNQDTLFIASSYSGTTEEVLSSLKEAEVRGAKIVGLAAGGELLEILQKKHLPFIKFEEKYNPCGQPRYGLGYALGGLFNIFEKINAIANNSQEIKTILNKIKTPSLLETEKMAKQIAGFSPIVIASGFLTGNAHVLVNQLNETCKTFSEFHAIPELNHHLMEGLKRPTGNKLKFLFIESDLYTKRITARFEITKKVVQKNKISYTVYKTGGKTKLEQVINCLLFGSLLGLVLSIKYNEDPTEIPWVKYFKEQLGRI